MIRHQPIATFPIDKLRPNPRNARNHSKKQIRQLANSIARFGWTYPIVVDENTVILAGHARYSAAQLLGCHTVPVIVLSGLSDPEKRALALADNKIAANSGWDRKLLAEELGELATLLPEFDLDLEITGFEPAEVDSLLGDLADPEQDPADEVPALEKEAISRIGDLWELGPHRLLCGDAQSAAAYRLLMGGVSAAMVFTDLPYNVPIKRVQGRGRIKHREFVQASGEMSPAHFTRFLRRSLALAAEHSGDGSIHFVFTDWRHINELSAAGSSVYSELKNIVVWVKTNAGQGSFYRSQHELICVFKSGEGPHQNNVELGRHGRNRSNVWTYPGVNSFRAGRLDDLSVHPTPKPVALVADAIRDCSRRGEIVLDPFMGSGTTILAAERVGRRGYGLELDPRYVDAAIRRWQAYTRRDAVLKDSGETFDEVSAVRAGTRGAP
ncbi:MAG: site-specific DNA-methyltransferase [Rhodoplanes sp.]